MRKLLTGILAVLLIALWVVPAGAQGLKKVGYLDLSKVFDSYEKTREYDKALEGKNKPYENEYNARIEKLKQATDKLALMKEDEKQKAMKELEQMRADLLSFNQSARADMAKQRDEMIREILLEIEKVVSDFAKKEGYDFILNDRVLIYGNDALNVSDQILKILNDAYNKK